MQGEWISILISSKHEIQMGCCRHNVQIIECHGHIVHNLHIMIYKLRSNEHTILIDMMYGYVKMDIDLIYSWTTDWYDMNIVYRVEYYGHYTDGWHLRGGGAEFSTETGQTRLWHNCLGCKLSHSAKRSLAWLKKGGVSSVFSGKWSVGESWDRLYTHPVNVNVLVGDSSLSPEVHDKLHPPTGVKEQVNVYTTSRPVAPPCRLSQRCC